MIRSVRGALVHKDVGAVEVVTAGGVGYGIVVPATLLDRLPDVGEEVEIHTALVVRDDALELFGFASSRDRELFLRLQAASGVGPRLALALLGSLPAARLVRAIRAKDHAVLQTVSGVGRKTAERIGVELADKLDDLAVEAVEVAEERSRGAAVRALRSLGYGASEADDAVSRAADSLGDDDVEVEELVRRALKEL